MLKGDLEVGVYKALEIAILVDSGAVNIFGGILGEMILEGAFICLGGSILHGLHL